MRDDKEVVMTAVTNKPIIIKYASGRLREDKEIGLVAMNKSKKCYEFLGPNLKQDEEIDNSIWNMEFQMEDFCSYVFKNIMALLQSGESNCRFFIYLLENLLYEK